MVAVIGQRKAEVSLTTGRMYTTDEAFQIGLVDENVPDADEALKKGTEFLNNFQRISREYLKLNLIVIFLIFFFFIYNFSLGV